MHRPVTQFTHYCVLGTGCATLIGLAMQVWLAQHHHKPSRDLTYDTCNAITVHGCDAPSWVPKEPGVFGISMTKTFSSFND